MAIQRTTHLYEVLYRGGPGGFQGAHAVDLERVADGEQIYAETLLPARPITEAEFGDLLGGQSAALIEAADTARSERDMAITDRDAALLERDAAVSAAETANARMAEVEAELAAAGSE